MAEPTLFKNAFVGWTTSTGAAVYSQIAGVKSCQVPLSKAELANSVMGDGAETFYPGLISAPISVVSRQDFTTGGAALGAFGLDKEVWTRWNSELKFRVKVRPVNSAVSSVNPSYIFNRVGVFSHKPIGGGHGELLENPIELRLLSGCTVVRSSAT